MAYDADGNWIEEDNESPVAVADEEEKELTPEEEEAQEPKATEESAPEVPEGKEADIGEYIRRARLGGIGSGALGSNSPYPEGEGQGELGAVTPPGQTPGQELYKPGPKMQEYKEAVGSEPLHQDYHPSKWRSVLSTIAGIGSGVAFGPDAGKHVQETIRDSPYRRQLEDYQQKTSELGKSAQLEAGGNQAARQYYLDLAKVQSENTKSQANLSQKEAEASRAGYFKSRAKVADYSITPEGQQAAKDLAQARVRAPGEDLYKVVTLDGKTHLGVKQPGGAFKVGDTVIPPEQIDAEKTNKLGAREPNVGQPHVVGAGGVLVGNDGKPIFTNPRAPQQVQPLKVVGNDGIVHYLHAGDKVPEGARTISEEGQMNTPTAATRGRGEAASTAIAAGNDVISFANANRNSLGNLDNYWKNIMSGTPAADPTVAAFQGKVASWAAFQAAAHGFRSSSIMQEFEERVGKGPKNVDAVMAAIQGINDELQHAVDTGHGSSGPVSNGIPSVGGTFNGGKVLKVTRVK